MKTGSQQCRNTLLQHPRQPLPTSQAARDTPWKLSTWQKALTPLPIHKAILLPQLTAALRRGSLPFMTIQQDNISCQAGNAAPADKSIQRHQTCSKFQNPLQLHTQYPGDKTCNTLPLKLAGHKSISDSFERSVLLQADGNAVAWMSRSSMGAAEPSIFFSRALSLQQGPGQLLINLNLPREQPTFCLCAVPQLSNPPQPP